MIAKSVFDYSWIDEIIVNNPVLIIAEGLLMYFNENKVEELINKLVNSFTQSEMLFDVITSVVVEKNKEHNNSFLKNAPFLWGIKDIKEIKRFNPKIIILNEWNYSDYHNGRRNEFKVGFKRVFSGRIVHLRFQ